MTEIQDIIKAGTAETLSQLQALHERIQAIAREFDGLSDEVAVTHIALDDAGIGEPELQGLRLLNRVRLLIQRDAERRVLLEEIASRSWFYYLDTSTNETYIQCHLCQIHALEGECINHAAWCPFASEEWSRFDGNR